MAATGEVTHTENLVLVDVDGTMMRSEGAGSYWPALLTEMAAAFPDQLAQAGVHDGGSGLERAWYELRGRASTELALSLPAGQSLDLPDFNEWWQRQPQNTESSRFDPLNCIRAVLNISQESSDRWLAGLRTRQPALAQKYAFEGALDLWQALADTPDTKAVGHLFTKGGEVLQPHKAHELIGAEAMKHTTVIFGGNKAEMINESYDARTRKYEWKTEQGLLVADRIAIVEDSFQQVEQLDDRESVMAVLIMQGAVALEQPSHPRMKVVGATRGVAPVLRESGYLPH